QVFGERYVVYRHRTEMLMPYLLSRAHVWPHEERFRRQGREKNRQWGVCWRTSMRMAHAGHTPVIDPTAVVAPTAVIAGDVHIGAGMVVLAGAIITSQGAPMQLGQHCVIMEHAVMRGAGAYPCTLGKHVLVGPHAHMTGATVNGCAFLATGASVFNGAVLEEGVVIAINAV